MERVGTTNKLYLGKQIATNNKGKTSYKLYKRYALKLDGLFVTNVNYVNDTAQVESFSVATGALSNSLDKAWGTDSHALAVDTGEQCAAILKNIGVEKEVQLFDTWEEGEGK